MWRSIAYIIGVHPKDVECLKKEASFYHHLLEEGETKLAIRSIASILCNLVFENQKFTDIILSVSFTIFIITRQH